MNINTTGIAAGAAGLPAMQTAADTERAQQAIAARQRRTYHVCKAEAAAGVGEADGEDHQPAERDADGRRPWEDLPEIPVGATPHYLRKSRDPSRQSGKLLDVTG